MGFVVWDVVLYSNSYLCGRTLEIDKNSWVGTFQDVEVEQYWLLPAKTLCCQSMSLLWSTKV